MATKEQILGFLSKPRQVQAIPIEGFGDIHVRMLNCGERARLLAAVQGDAIPDAITQSLVMLSFGLSDEVGSPLFGAGDVEGPGQLDAQTVEQAVKVFSELNKFGSDAVDDAAKN